MRRFGNLFTSSGGKKPPSSSQESTPTTQDKDTSKKSRKRNKLVSLFTQQGSQSNTHIAPTPFATISRISSPRPPTTESLPSSSGVGPASVVNERIIDSPALPFSSNFNQNNGENTTNIGIELSISSGDLLDSPSNPRQLTGTSQVPETDIRGNGENVTTLWMEAYGKLADKHKTNLGNIEKLHDLQLLLDTVNEATEKRVAGQWRIRWGGQEIDVREKAGKVINWINKFKEIGDIAVQYDPVHVALPWAGIRFILILATGEQELMGAAIIGVERIALLVGRCALYEQMYLGTGVDVPELAKSATTDLRNTLLALYTAILQVLSQLKMVFNRNVVQNFGSVLSGMAHTEIQALDRPETLVDKAVELVEVCYNVNTRNQQSGKSDELRALLKQFLPVMTQVDATVKEIYTNIKDSERIEILKWLSTVPYLEHHDFASHGRVEGTGQWLFERVEFRDWENSDRAEILWLHGIPGAGKTKLISATIDKLKNVSNKVVFFYCKRDEDNRRDRQKVLLALVKQLACPVSGAGIHVEIMNVWNKDKQEPFARGSIPVDTSVVLLSTLLQDYEKPILVIDALDECSKETCALILKDLRLLMSKSQTGIRILISSRHSLDIEDHMHGLPHVCIEARDNAQDIANYVSIELASRVEDKRLLRGNVSHELRESIRDVLINKANGMFLWVDYQIQELCRMGLEQDIRERLGRLPEDLTSVYKEIMDSIKSQRGSSPRLATCALKWMLVARRPFRPTELLTAIDLDLRRRASRTSQWERDPSLKIELVIQACGGLVLLDSNSGVVRFAHLSVQEYLEERNTEWDAIDAHLLVAESALWILQDPSALATIQDSPFYDYVAQNWFRHCRSYQDLIVENSVSNNILSKHKLVIPLLNSFLGSFDQASTYYVKWHDWVDAGGIRRWSGEANLLRDAVRTSNPVSPIFLAAYSGLGILVNWLWLSKQVSGNMTNDYGHSLLYIAAAHGSSWVVGEILKKYDDSTVCVDEIVDMEVGGYHTTKWTALQTASYHGQLDIVTFLLDRGAKINVCAGSTNGGTALMKAAGNGHEDIVSLLLDRGADVNLVGGEYGTALAAASYYGNGDIVALLLDRGANVNLVGGEYGTALAAAAFGESGDIVALLLDRGVDVNLVGGRYGTALAAAAFRENEDIIALLLDRGANVNLVGGGKYGTALAAAAAYYGNGDIVALLLDRGADVNLVGGEYGTALAAAAFRANEDIVALLLDRGADVNLVGGKYGTALAAAAFGKNENLVTLLLDRGADVNLVGAEYGTALVAAASTGHRSIVKILLDRGAVKPDNWEEICEEFKRNYAKITPLDDC